MERKKTFEVNKIRIVVEPLERFTESIDKRVEKAIKKGIGTQTLEISLSSYDDISKILTPERIRIIHTIRENRPKSISELANILNRDRRAVVTDLDILETYGIVDVEESKEDSRVVSIPHTARALEIRI